MNSKKYISLFLLLLANLVILAHTVVPHHHHDGAVVAVCNRMLSNDCHDLQSHNHHESNGHKHSSEDCPLNELYARSASNEFSENSDDSKVLDFDLNFPTLCYDVAISIEIKNYGKLFQKPYINSYHTRYITRSLGLRAPPFC